MATKLIVGLGNYGTEYDFTRHNVGFMALDRLLLNIGVAATWQNKFNGLFTSFNYIVEGVVHKLILIKPQTYMNNSGNCVSLFKSYYKVVNNDIYVIYDDLDLAVAKIKLSQGGGSAGHNGIKSLDTMLGKDTKIDNNYVKIKVGIDRPEHKSAVVNYVLNKFTHNELDLVNSAVDSFFVPKYFDLLLSNKLTDVMSLFYAVK